MSKILANNSYVNKNKSILEMKLETFIENGRKEISSREELKEFPAGSLISYINIYDTFKPCGFLTKVTKDYFIYLAPDFESKFKVKFINVKKMYVGSVYETKNDLVSIIKSTQPKTKFEVVIDGIVVFYAKDSFNVKRFQHTKKYKLMDNWIKFFKK